jgi:hypothetical protein
MTSRRLARWRAGLLISLVLCGIAVALPSAAYALVGTLAGRWVPYIEVNGTGDNYAHASTEIGTTVYVGGQFSKVYEKLTGTDYDRTSLYAYDENTNLVQPFSATFDGPVWGLAHSPDGRYLWAAGKFNTVNGQARKGLAQFDLSTGQLTSWNAQLDAQARTVDYVNGHLIVGGAFDKVKNVVQVGLASLDPTTGKLQQTYLNANISGSVASTAGVTMVYHTAVNSTGTQMAVMGNFTSAGGATHWRTFLLDLGDTAATVSAWNAPILAQPCRIVNYVSAASFSQDGTWLAMANTGYRNTALPSSNLTTTVCDAVVRFPTTEVDNVTTTWRNYTGCDSLYSVLVRPDAVYVGGHERYLNNQFACDTAGPGSVSRPGIGAVDPSTGLALSWNPTRSRGSGADFLQMTTKGLLILSDCAASGIAGDPSSGANLLATGYHPCVGLLTGS